VPINQKLTTLIHLFSNFCLSSLVRNSTTAMADNLPSSSNPSSSQFIPGKLRREITKKEAEIEEINDRWRRNRDEQTKIEEEIEKKKKVVKQLQREIRVEEKRVKDYAEQYPVMQEMINERYDWVRSIKNLYPYDN